MMFNEKRKGPEKPDPFLLTMSNLTSAGKCSIRSAQLAKFFRRDGIGRDIGSIFKPIIILQLSHTINQIIPICQIILDLGDTVDGLYDLLGRCSKVYTPYIEEGAAKAKLNQYEENLRSAGYGEILKKTVRRRMGKPRNPVALEASASKITEFPDRERKS